MGHPVQDEPLPSAKTSEGDKVSPRGDLGGRVLIRGWTVWMMIKMTQLWRHAFRTCVRGSGLWGPSCLNEAGPNVVMNCGFLPARSVFRANGVAPPELCRGPALAVSLGRVCSLGRQRAASR